MTNSKTVSYILLFILFAFYVIDVGNPLGMRQSTEPLYLQISHEMFERGSIITPYYLGQHHWTKPPLHFWLPYPLYAIFGANLFASRLALALFGFFSVLWSAKWLEKRKEVPVWLTSVLLLGSLGFYKYSRTYMMETLFAMLPFIGALLYFQFLEEKKRGTFIWAILITGLGVLVKGPVTLVMAFGGGILYQALLWFRERRSIFWPSFFFFLFSTLIASSWFIAASIKHGSEFYQFFFVKEHANKFKLDHPLWKIPAGLILYAMPWTPLLLINGLKTIRETLWKDRLFCFLFFNGLCFFVLWFFPTQRSLHYAIPSLPFFLMMTAMALHKIKPASWLKWTLIPAGVGLATISLVISYLLSGLDLIIFLLIAVLAVASSVLISQNRQKLGLHCLVFSLMTLWVFGVHPFAVEPIPQQVLKKVEDKKLYVMDRRSFFFGQAAGREVIATNGPSIKGQLSNPEIRVIMYDNRRDNLIEGTDFEIAERWWRWNRKIRWKDVKNSFISRDIRHLQTDVYLIKGINLDSQ